MKQKVLTLIGIFAVVILLIEGGRVHGASDAEIIPPEVLKQMDPDIRSGKRPKIHWLKQTEIFGLRDKPTFDADFVSFSFDPDALSSVQKDIMAKWITSGANKILLRGEGVYKYRRFLSGVSVALRMDGQSSSRSRLRGVTASCSPLRHPVNTDVRNIRIATFIWQNEGYNPQAGHFEVKNLPPESTVILDVSNAAAAGAFFIGEGMVYFRPTVLGTDARRWYLNWWHWALGLGVPGAADTGILGGGSSGQTLKESVKYDAMILKNADTITGTIENETFRMKTSYGDMTFKSNEIAKVVFEGAGSNVDVVRLKVGDKFSGVVQDKKIKIKLVSGTSVEIDKDKVKEIQIRKTKTEKKKD